MLELGPYGSMRGARSNARPYRDPRPNADMAKKKRAPVPGLFLDYWRAGG
jgi:hypothetical protein